MNAYEKLYVMTLAAIGVTIAVQSYHWQKHTNKSLRVALQERLAQWKAWTNWRSRIIEEEHRIEVSDA